MPLEYEKYQTKPIYPHVTAQARNCVITIMNGICEPLACGDISFHFLFEFLINKISNNLIRMYGYVLYLLF